MPKVWEQEGHLRAGACLRGDFQEELKSYLSTPTTRESCIWEGAVQTRLLEGGNHREKRGPYIPFRYGLLPNRGVVEAICTLSLG
jgi:hypothetical protein